MSSEPLPKPTDLPTIWHVSEPLWEQIAPLLKIEKPRKKPGCPRADDRRIFNGLIYLARTGSQWCALPAEFGPKSTAYDRFREWLEHGCLEKVWAWLLKQYDQLIGIDWQWLAADGCIVKPPLGKRGAEGEPQATGRNPTDRGKSGSKRHLLTEGKGVPLAVVLRGANRHDMKKLADLLDAIVIERPDPDLVEQHLCLDRGYDYDECRSEASGSGYVVHIPDTSLPVPSPDDPNRHPPRRWVVEVGHSWFNRFRRLLIRARQKLTMLSRICSTSCLSYHYSKAVFIFWSLIYVAVTQAKNC